MGLFGAAISWRDLLDIEKDYLNSLYQLLFEKKKIMKPNVCYEVKSVPTLIQVEFKHCLLWGIGAWSCLNEENWILKLIT